MERVGKEDLKKITDLLKKADIEAIATETGFSISYVRKVLYGTKSNIKILISASERAILKKKEQEDTEKKLKDKVKCITQK
jgi:ABC-type Zn uptake system ZnuABC Zn-binding protein ZnuA